MAAHRAATRRPLDLINTTMITCRRARSRRLETRVVSAFLLPHLAIHRAEYPIRPALACSERSTGLRVVTFAAGVKLETAVHLTNELDRLFVDMPRVDVGASRDAWSEEFREWYEQAEMAMRWWRETHQEYVWQEEGRS